MTGTEGLNAGEMRIRLRIGCWFRAGGVPVEPIVGRAKNIEFYGRIPEPVSRGKRISNWLLKRRVTNADERKAGRPMEAVHRPEPNVISRVALAALF